MAFIQLLSLFRGAHVSALDLVTWRAIAGGLGMSTPQREWRVASCSNARSGWPSLLHCSCACPDVTTSSDARTQYPSCGGRRRLCQGKKGPSFTALKGQLCSHCGRVGVCRAVLRRGLAHPRQTRLHHRGGHRRAPPAGRGASGTAVEKRGDTFGWGGRLWAVGLAVLQLGGGASAAAGRGGSAAAGREGVGRCDRMTVGFLGREDRRRR